MHVCVEKWGGGHCKRSVVSMQKNKQEGAAAFGAAGGGWRKREG